MEGAWGFSGEKLNTEKYGWRKYNDNAGVRLKKI